MTEINHTQWTPVDMCIHLERLMKLKRKRLHDDLCTHDNMVKYGCSDKDLIAMT